MQSSASGNAPPAESGQVGNAGANKFAIALEAEGGSQTVGLKPPPPVRTSERSALQEERAKAKDLEKQLQALQEELAETKKLVDPKLREELREREERFAQGAPPDTERKTAVVERV